MVLLSNHPIQLPQTGYQADAIFASGRPAFLAISRGYEAQDFSQVKDA